MVHFNLELTVKAALTLITVSSVETACFYFIEIHYQMEMVYIFQRITISETLLSVKHDQLKHVHHSEYTYHLPEHKDVFRTIIILKKANVIARK